MGDDANEVEVCAADDLWEGDMQSFDVGEHEVLLVNIEGRVHAWHGVCPHQSVALVEGSLEGKVLTCRAHLWQFDVCTGRGINPATACLKEFPVSVVDGKVRVGLQPVSGEAVVVTACSGGSEP